LSASAELLVMHDVARYGLVALGMSDLGPTLSCIRCQTYPWIHCGSVYKYGRTRLCLSQGW